MSNARIKDETTGIYYKRHGKAGIDAELDDKFDITVPKTNTIVLLIIFGALVAGQFYYLREYLWATPLFLAITIVPLLLWAKLGPAISEKLILDWLKKIINKQKNNPMDIFIGFPKTLSRFFIEANPMDLDMSNTKIFINRIKEVVFLSVGLQTVFAKLLAPYYFDSLNEKYCNLPSGCYTGINELVIDATIYLGPFALLILFLFVPLFWICEDCQIYRIDELQDVSRLGAYLRTGLLSKILGFLGIVLAFDAAKSFAIDTVIDNYGLTEMVQTNQYTLEIYMITFTQFAAILIACSAAPFLITFFYLTKYHATWVNNLRIKASEFIPIGTIQVRTVAPAELQLLTHPEKLRERKTDFFDTIVGKIVLIIATAGCAFLCFFMAFLF